MARIVVGLTCLMMVGLWTFLGGAVFAQETPPDLACKGCHTDQERLHPLPSGETLKLGVDLAVLAESVHGSTAQNPIFCTDCHTPQIRYRYPHQPNPAQTRQEFVSGAADGCQACHPSLQEHNPGHLLATDNPNLPTCTDCHGGHQVESVASMTADPIATCRSCHQTFADPRVAQGHDDLLLHLSGDQTCQTCHTDEPLSAPDAKCRTCHSLMEGASRLISGQDVQLHVDPQILADSVHGQHQLDEHNGDPLLCTDCHQDQQRYGYPHPPMTAADLRSLSLQMDDLCAECHTDVSIAQGDGVHEAALNQGMLVAASCADCHGSHAVQEPHNPRERVSKTCSNCHSQINTQYESSVHGAALLGDHNPDVPVCIDCHGVHNIQAAQTAQFRVESPDMCADCHADPELMAKYGISTDVFETYVADFHGTTVTIFEKQTPWQETNKAVCYDCHGIHDIRATDDENSHVIKENLLTTCQQCHPDATASFPDSWTSHFKPSMEHNPLVYLVNLFYQIVIPVTISGFALFIGSDIFRRTGFRLGRGRKKKQETDHG